MTPEPKPAAVAGPSPEVGPCFAAWKVHLGLVFVLTLLALLPNSTLRACILGILAGAGPALVLRRRWALLEWIGVSGAMTMAFWPVAAVVAYLSSGFFLLAWFPALAAALICGVERFRARRVCFTFGIPDRAALAFTLLLAVPVVMVALSNGPFVTTAGTPGYEARSWFSSDSFYLFSLAQAAMERRTYPPENPFFPGVPNRYPSLMHCGLAAIAYLGKSSSAVDCWRFFPFFALACAPLALFAPLRRSGRTHVPGLAWIAAACAGCVLLARPDFLVAIHSQAVALPVLLLVLWSLGPPRFGFSPARYGLAGALVLLLVFSHTLTAAAALAILGTEALRVSGRGKPWGGRTIALVTWGILASAFLAVNRYGLHGMTANSWAPRLAVNVLRYHGPWLIPLAVITIALAWRQGKRRGWHAVGVAAIALLGLLYAAKGARLADPVESWFALFNARRFWFFCLVAAIPGILLIPRRLAWASVALIATSMVFLPDDSRRDTFALVSGEPRIAGSPVLQVLSAVRAQTPPDARIQTNLGSWVAAFSGRSALVADPINLWANGTVDSREFDHRVSSQNALFDSQDASVRLSSLIREGCGFVVAYGPAADRLPTCTPDSGSSAPLCVQILVKESGITFGKVRRSQ